MVSRNYYADKLMKLEVLIVGLGVSAITIVLHVYDHVNSSTMSFSHFWFYKISFQYMWLLLLESHSEPFSFFGNYLVMERDLGCMGKFGV